MTTKTLDQLTPGDIATVIFTESGPHQLPRPVVVEKALGPVSEDAHATQGVKLMHKGPVEHFMYPHQAQVVYVRSAWPAGVKGDPRPRQARRTIDGVTWVRHAETNPDGGVKWTTEDGRFELGTYLCGGTCFEPHPVKLSKVVKDKFRDDKRAYGAAKLEGNHSKAYTIRAHYVPEEWDALMDGAKGYRCNSGNTHESWSWGCYDVEADTAVVVPNYSTMTDAARSAAHGIKTGARGL